ncbi:MAG: DNA-3-methyladenine glycosylase I [Rhizobiaceae bacterium]|nr:DNA-3-methyladenine glycosylase I [Rhizobiaceae bacterium]
MATEENGLVTGNDGRTRCFWAGPQEDYVIYHDEEWGMPVDNDTRLFEKICLEGFQSGLSWYTILSKRENFREAFRGFDIAKVAAMDDSDIERLVLNPGIIRHRGKIRSTINNARRALELVREKGSLAAHFWSYEPKDRAPMKSRSDIPATTEISTAISKDLKKRGWSFVGPTTAYAFMQAMGLVNDHIEGCHCHARIEKARAEFDRPA